MKKLVYLFVLIMASAAAVTSCGSSSKESNEMQADTVVYTVDQIYATPDSFVDRLINVEGEVSHLCKHGGRKAFLMGADSLLLRCEATAEMGGLFPTDVVGKDMTVCGLLREERVDEEAVRGMERQYAAQLETIAREQGADTTDVSKDGACTTEKVARGQAGLESFQMRMADYRARIAERAANEGKSYLSFYYLEATGYDVK